VRVAREKLANHNQQHRASSAGDKAKIAKRGAAWLPVLHFRTLLQRFALRKSALHKNGLRISASRGNLHYA
jgi:hypothetical protein